MSAGDVDPEGVQILSTEGMINRPRISAADEFIVATEVGILHRLRRENPTKQFLSGERACRVRVHEGDDAAQGAEFAASVWSITSRWIRHCRAGARRRSSE